MKNIPTLSLIMLSALLLFVPVLGQEVEVSNSYGLPFVVEGRVVNNPAKVSRDSTVCVAYQVYYITAERRLVFTGWTNGESAPCIKAEEPVGARYREEVLVVVDSTVEELRTSLWVGKGERITLNAEKQYLKDGYRYVFQRWSRGEQPFNISNTLVVTDPAVVEAVFKIEVRLEALSAVGVKVNGSGWYGVGETAVVAAPREVMLSSYEKLVFKEWVSVGANPQVIYNPASHVATLEVKRPAVVRAEYDRFYLVKVMGPEGVVVESWFREGDTLQLSLPAVIDVDPGRVRLVFEGWRGDITASTPTAKTVVTKPINAEAVYRMEYRLEVKSPAGATGSGWYRPNSTAVVNAPGEAQAALFFKRVLSHYTGDCGEKCVNNSPLVVRIDSPKYIEAVYRVEPDLLSIAVVGSVASALSAAYYFSRPSKKGPETKSMAAEQQAQERLFCHNCGALNSGVFRYCLKCGAPLHQPQEILNTITSH
ncbi:MAG: zinc ribbon domain-containing protein [Candidatus Caldarchaeum sp.]